MALTIYKISSYLNWRAGSATYPGGSGGIEVSMDFSNYYTKIELQTPGLSFVDFANITNAYHNGLLGLQGGDYASSGDSSGYTGDFYHLDEYTYYRVNLLNFVYSLYEDTNHLVSLVNDQATPGNDKYYGTDITGTKGWFDLPVGGDSLWEETSDNYLIPVDLGIVGIIVNSVSSEGDLILQSASEQDIYLTPGNSTGTTGYIYFGGISSVNDTLLVQASGTLSNINLWFYTKGAGSIIFHSSTINLAIDQNSIWMETPLVTLGGLGADVTLRPPISGAAPTKGINVILTAGEPSSAGDYNGGDVFIYGGSPHQSGLRGDVYFGDGNTGYLKPVDSSITNVVMYDPDTGLLSYGEGGGTPPGGDSLWEEVEEETDYLQPIDPYIGIRVGGIVYVDGNGMFSNSTDEGNGATLGIVADSAKGGPFSYETKGGDLWLLSGSGIDSDPLSFGGNIYLVPGYMWDEVIYSNIGDIYLGDGGDSYGGALKERTSETNLVYYDPATGLITYGIGGDSSAWTIDSNNILMPVDEFDGIDLSSFVTLSGSGQVIKTFSIPLGQLTYSNGTPPDVGGVGGSAVFLVFYTINDSSQFSFKVPIDWAVGTDIAVVFYWGIDEDFSEESAWVKWKLDFVCCPTDMSEPLNDTTSSYIAPSSLQIPATAATITRQDDCIIVSSNIASEDVIACTLNRVSSEHTDPTAEPFIVAIEIQYTSDKLGGVV